MTVTFARKASVESDLSSLSVWRGDAMSHCDEVCIKNQILSYTQRKSEEQLWQDLLINQ